MGLLRKYDFPSLLSAPSDIAAGDDAVWVTEPFAGKIARIDSRGLLSEFDVPYDGIPEEIVRGSDGRMWFSQLDGKRLGVIDGQGKILDYAVPTEYQRQIALGPDGRIWAATFGSMFSNRTGKVAINAAGSSATNQVVAIDSSGNASLYAVTKADAFETIGALAPGKGGIWLSVQPDSIIYMSLDGKIFRRFAVPLRQSGVLQMMEGINGTLWFSDFYRAKL